MSQTLKTYNLFHNIWDKLIFGLLAPVVIILLHALLSLALEEAAILSTIIYSMFAEVFRDYFSFNGVYGQESHHAVLRSSFYGKKLFLSAILGEHVRNLLHYVIVFSICGYITSVFTKTDSYYALLIILLMLSTYTMNTLAVNILRYFDNFTLYPLLALPFVAIASALAGLFTLFNFRITTTVMLLFIVLAVLLAIVTTILSCYHAKRCYEKSFEDREKPNKNQ